MHSMTITQATQKVLADRYEHGRNYGPMASNMRTIEGYFGELALSKLTSNHIYQFKLELKAQGMAPTTINRKLSALSVVLKAAVTWGVIKEVPKIEWNKESNGRIRWLTKQEEVKLLAFFQGSEMQGLCEFLLDTGVRLSESLRLSRRDVDFEQNLIHVWESKGDKPRSIPMTDRVRDILTLMIKLYGEQPLFTQNVNWIQYQWSKARQFLGYQDDPDFVLHALRHTFASRLVQAGVDLYRVQRLMGHSSIKVTERYAHLAPADLQSAISTLNSS